MCLSTPSAPTPPPRAPETPRMPDAGASESAMAADRRRRAAAAGQGRSTILTGPRGVTGSNQQSGTQVTGKTLLGT